MSGITQDKELPLLTGTDGPRPVLRRPRIPEGFHIGSLLADEGLVPQERIDEALALQAHWSMHLGEVLIAKGWVRPYQFYTVLAEQLSLQFVDMLKEKPARNLLNPDEIDRYVAEQCLPWRSEECGPVYATTDPIEAERRLRKRHPDGRFGIVVTSKFDILWTVQREFPEQMTGRAIAELDRRDPEYSARRTMTVPQALAVYGVLLVLGSTLVVYPIQTLYSLNALLSFAFIAVFAYKLLLTIIGAIVPKVDEQVTDDEVRALNDKELPIYTVLVPLFREPEGLTLLVDSLRKLDYPLAKLDIKLILEETDQETVEVAKHLGMEGIFDIIRVPPSEPQTKPKACNYGLIFARGDHVVIYDAEDRPEPDQLKKAIIGFRKAPANTACLQARLNYYNPRENWLSRMFTIDYSLWFDFMLPALDYLRQPIPLGGTSNHFRTAVLRQVWAWDPFNVTEDADLGVRLAQKGYRVGVINSTTFEEANCRVPSWIRQRSRWMKGYMQTWLVHMRHPLHLLSTLGPRGFWGFQLFVGGNVLLSLVNPLFWALYIWWLFTMTTALDPYFPGVVLYTSLFNLLIGNATFTYLAMVAPFKRKEYDLIAYSLTIFAYWALVSVAAYRGLIQLITAPFYWEKTRHAVSAQVRAELVKMQGGM